MDERKMEVNLRSELFEGLGGHWYQLYLKVDGDLELWKIVIYDGEYKRMKVGKYFLTVDDALNWADVYIMSTLFN